METISVFLILLLTWLEVAIIRHFHLKKIRRLATVHASHYNPQLAADGEISFPIKKDSPWRDQSHAYREMLAEMAILIHAFAVGVSSLMVGLTWQLITPSGWGWKALASFGLYIIFLPLAYYWGFKTIPALITGWLHYPHYYFHTEEIAQGINPWHYVIEWLFFGSYSLVVLSSQWLFGVFLWAVMSSLGRLSLSFVRRRYPNWESEDDILENFDFENFTANRIDQAEKIRCHPNFDALLASLPEHTRDITLLLLENDEVKQDMLKIADLAPEDEWQATPLLKNMFECDPRFLPVVVGEMLYTLNRMLEDFKPKELAAAEKTS